MKGKFLIIGVIAILLFSSGSVAYTWTTASAGVEGGGECEGDIATVELASGQPNWELVIPVAEMVEQLDQDSPYGSDDGWHEIKDAKWAAQSFLATLTGELTKVALYLKKDKTPGELTIEIRDTVEDGGLYKPGSTVLASMTSSDVVSTTGEEYEFTFTSPAAIIAGTPYVILLHEPGGVGDGKYEWTEFKPYDIYPDGNVWRSDDGGASWSVGGGGIHDFYFRTYVLAEVEPVTQGLAPTGNLFLITPNACYTGDLQVKVYLTNVGALSKAYNYLILALYLTGSVEAGESPNYRVLSLTSGVATFNLVDVSGGTHTLSVISGSYEVVSADPEEWEEGWSVTPELYCEVTQR